MRVLLIQPPIQDFYRTEFREYPLGLLYLAASLRKDGFLPSILDARRSKKTKNIPTPSELSYLNRYYTKENNLFLNYKHFGLSYEKIKEQIVSYEPDAVCISSMFTPYMDEVIEVARTVKSVSTDIRVIAGSYHATVDPLSIISTGFFDHVVRGEGEQVLSEVLNGTHNNEIIPDNSKPPATIDDLETLPLPARDLIAPDNYRYQKKRYSMILTSRGCPQRCSFCSVHAVAGSRYRKRKIDSVLEEIDELVTVHGIEVIDFQDDNLLFDKERIKIILESVVRKYKKKQLQLMATNGLNVSGIDKELLELMIAAGFEKLDLALGTGEVSARKNLNRPESIQQYETVVHMANQLGLKTTTYIILGIPTQPLEEMNETVEYLKTKPTLIAPSIFYNVPGMPIFDTMQKYENCDKSIARRSSAFNCSGDNFTNDDIFNLFKEIRNHNIGKSTVHGG